MLLDIGNLCIQEFSGELSMDELSSYVKKLLQDKKISQMTNFDRIKKKL